MTSAALSDNIRTSTPTIQYIAEIGINNEYNIDESFPPSHRSLPIFSFSYLYSLLSSLLFFLTLFSPPFSSSYLYSLLSYLLPIFIVSSPPLLLSSSLLFSSPLFYSPLLSSILLSSPLFTTFPLRPIF